MGLSVGLDEGRVACTESIQAFVRAVDGMSEYDLLGASRCHGWARLDVVVHVLAGWQEMLGGLVSPVDSPPTVDAASYWPAFADQYADEDPVAVLMAQRRRASAYARPSSALAQLSDVAAAMLRGVDSFRDRPCLWQGHVFAPGDYLAIWAVEDVVHHLDLMSDEPAPAGALGLTRSTVEALAGEPLPQSWTDVDATLIGTGRMPVPDGTGPVGDRLPVLG
jgi:hypothetical protein